MIDILKRASNKWWMFWLAVVSYCGISVGNVLSAHWTSVGREGYHKVDWFDFTVLSTNVMIAVFTSIRALMNKDYHDVTKTTSTTTTKDNAS